MAKKIYIDVIVDDKGTTKKVAVDAQKLGVGLEKTAKEAKTADRTIKGTAQASSNATKNFSKMRGAIEGGLVPAYAKLAATLFAVSAAFRFLEQAANYQALTQAQEQFALKTGKSLSLLTKSLQEATDGQLQFQEAAQAAAIGTAAGLTSKQLTELSTVAKNASLALGRDLTDSFNRLIRGVTKAEPELLDELGIILRLDTATRKYATAIGKAQDALTPFERSQAVANDVLAQGQEKFGDLNVEVNAFTKLAKSVDDAIKKITQTFQPLADFLANTLSSNIEATIGLLALLGASLTKSMIPAAQALAPLSGSQLGGMLQGYSGSAARQARLDAGTFTRADVKDLRKANQTAFENRGTVFKSANAEMLKSNKRLFDSMDAHVNRSMEKQAGFFRRMTLQSAAELHDLRAEHGKVMGTMVKASRSAGRLISGALRFAGLVAGAVVVFNLIREAYLKFTQDEDARKLEQNNRRIADSFSEMSEKVLELATNAEFGASRIENLVKRANILNNLNLKGLEDFQFETKEIERPGGISGPQIITPGSMAAGLAPIEKLNVVTDSTLPLIKGLKDEFKALDETLNLTGEEAKEYSSIMEFLNVLSAQNTTVTDDMKKRLGDLIQKLIVTNGSYFESGREVQEYASSYDSLTQSVKGFEDALSRARKSFLPGLVGQQGAVIKELAGSLDSVITQAGKETLAGGEFGKNILQNLTAILGETRGRKVFQKFVSDTITGSGGYLLGAEGLDLVGLQKELEKIGEQAVTNTRKNLQAVTTAKRNLIASEQKLATMESTTFEQQIAVANQQVVVAQDKVTAAKAAFDSSTAELKVLKGTSEEGSEQFKLIQQKIRAQEDGLAQAQSALAITKDQTAEQIQQVRLQQLSLQLAKEGAAVNRARAEEDARRRPGFLERSLSGTGLGAQFQRRRAIGDAELRRDRAVEDLITAQNAKDRRLREKAPISDNELQQLDEAIKNADSSITVLTDNLRKVREETSVLDNIGSSVFSNFDSAIDGIIDGTKSMKEAFGDMAISILSDIAKMITKMAIMNMLFPGGGGLFGSNFLAPSGRAGMIAEPVPGYSTGGIARGRQAGYPAILHGTEAVVPLPNGKEIPVQMRDGGGNNNVVVNVNMDGSSSQENSQGSDQRMKEMGRAISQAVQEELQKQKRPGGILSPYGAA